MRRSSLKALLVGALTFAVLGASSPDPVQWSASVVGVPTRGSAVLSIRATIEEDWYIYAMVQPASGPSPLRFRAPQGSGVTIGKVVAPAPSVSYDQGFRARVAKYYGAPAFTLPIRLSGAQATVPIEVRYQACNDNICLPPRTKTVQVGLIVRSR